MDECALLSKCPSYEGLSNFPDTVGKWTVNGCNAQHYRRMCSQGYREDRRGGVGGNSLFWLAVCP